MEQAIAPATAAELAAPLLQAVINIGLAGVTYYLYRQHHKRYFALWSLVWVLYTVRIAVIGTFLVTTQWVWLFAHQVITGWTAIAFLYAALVFAVDLRWRRWYWAVVAFPLVWSYVAIYQLDHFLWAAGPAVLFLSLATMLTAVVFWRHRRQASSGTAGLIAVMMTMWALHHLDYPFLRARGAWNPWGYYLDIVFAIVVGFGFLFLVLEEREEELAQLASKMLEQHEEERRRLARELHDETAQVFSAVKMQLGLVREKIPESMGEQVEQVESLVDHGIGSIRNVTNSLRPTLLDDLGLEAALRALVDEFKTRTGVAVDLVVSDGVDLTAEAELVVFRALQEGLANVAQHADARHARVTVTAGDSELSLTVSDDGVGAPSSLTLDDRRRNGHMGIAGMRERLTRIGGSVHLTDSELAGAKLSVRIPVGPHYRRGDTGSGGA